ncbi:hypothetical protein LTR94_024498 [Friedmanniomyces endolithicus]|nr:hypothetical protein LTR94_024498 [Friedmanniomyces endolithicus]
MARREWKLTAHCGRCGLVMVANVDTIAQAKGRDWSPWGKSAKCRRLHCAGRMTLRGYSPRAGHILTLKRDSLPQEPGFEIGRSRSGKESTMSVQDFFDSYGRALAQRNISSIARHWAVPSLVLGPDGSIAVSATAEVEAFFEQSIAQYDGISEARATIGGTTELSPGLTACEIRWDHLDGDGKVIGGENGYYILRQRGATGTIEVYSPRD